MRIIIATDANFPHPNGVSTFTQNLAHSMSLLGHSVLVIAPSADFTSHYTSFQGIDVFSVRSIPVFVYNNFRVVLSILTKDDISKAIRDFRPDIIHVQGAFFALGVIIKIAKKMKIPAVGTNHFTPQNFTHVLHIPKLIENDWVYWGWKNVCNAYQNLDAVTTPTKAAADLIRSHGLNHEVLVISNGIDLQKFNPSHKSSPIRHSKILLYVGRLDHEKNVEFVLKALSAITPQIDIHFIIVGSGSLDRQLRDLSRDLNLSGRVSFLGQIPTDDLAVLYASSDCFIMPGTTELQSIATMEAMASGLPILAANALALPELVQNGKNGFLFNIEGNSLAKNIVKIFSDDKLRARMGNKSLEIIQKHELNKTMRQFESLYLKLI